MLIKDAAAKLEKGGGSVALFFRYLFLIRHPRVAQVAGWLDSVLLQFDGFCYSGEYFSIGLGGVGVKFDRMQGKVFSAIPLES